MSPPSEKPHEKAKRIKGIPPESTSFYSNPKFLPTVHCI